MNSMDRLAPIVLDVLESWTSTQWRRRTGYLFFGETIRVQTRLGHAAVDPEEVHYYSFADRYGSLSWLDKPRWSICRP